MSLLEINGLTHAFEITCSIKNAELTLNKRESNIGIVGSETEPEKEHP